MAEDIYFSADYWAVSFRMKAGGMRKDAETGNGRAGSTGADYGPEAGFPPLLLAAEAGYPGRRASQSPSGSDLREKLN